ncbi:hypothetical protein TM1040_0841 [Ruegeria sp. TM1040]|nr:hypothetical protein TM1040_0841 [Ruegeria sp. TM1040]
MVYGDCRSGCIQSGRVEYTVRRLPVVSGCKRHFGFIHHVFAPQHLFYSSLSRTLGYVAYGGLSPRRSIWKANFGFFFDDPGPWSYRAICGGLSVAWPGHLWAHVFGSIRAGPIESAGTDL